MKFKTLLLTFFILLSNLLTAQNSWIRINQLGYLNKSIKAAVLISKENINPKAFEVRDALTDEIKWKSENVKAYGRYGNFSSSFRLNFTEFKTTGTYYIKSGDIKSPNFRISNEVYNGSADFLLKYMRQQQCGYNPFSKDSCHTHDGFIIFHPTLDSTHIDVTGGWHDASDYLQYVTTSATAVFQMLFAYKQNPSSFADEYDKDGNPGSNTIPDILDVAKWGMDWLIKMNPKADMMFNQIADDRDHAAFTKPDLDPVSYGKGKERPVYFCQGGPQGVFKNKNSSTGLASTAGKFASSFMLGSDVFKKFYPEYSDLLRQKSFDAYKLGQKYPGVCQTAPCVSPYFYEEDNWTDDMELAATQLYKYTGQKDYLKDAVSFGKQEPVTPWMGADTARHYQWFPFLNLGHYFLAADRNKDNKVFLSYLKKGIDDVYKKGKDNAFQIGIPFIWCSNNLVSAMITQANLYYKISGDAQYREMEASLRDWLFGCNPWGTSMITGLPSNGDNPVDPHSAFSAVFHTPIDGGLVDGPVYSTIYNMLKGLKLSHEDQYAQFQTGRLIYHDDWGDYSTNEPTMDGTAGLTYYFSAMQAEGMMGKKSEQQKKYEFDQGGIYRTDRSKKEIHLVFTAHEFADGAEIIRNVLKKHDIKASFFFTGDFYREQKFTSLIKNLIKDGHYLGNHSDKHLLYCSWEKRDSLLVTKEEFSNDLKAGYAGMKKFGITKESAPLFLPPFEWYNQKITDWTKELGLTMVNYTPGTYSNADYTTPDMGQKYLTSDEIYKRIIGFEKKNKDGLNGFILLTHFGTDSRRTDKFYNKLDTLITELEAKGYKFTPIR